MYLSAENINQLYKRIATQYGFSKDRVTVVAEYSTEGENITLVKQYKDLKTYSDKVRNKTDEVYSKLTRRCEPYKTEYINKYSFKEIPITSKEDLYPLVRDYKKVKVYFETGEKRGTKKLYALVK